MSDRIHVATRKGLFTAERANGGRWSISPTAFVGDPVTMLLDDGRDGTLYAALNLGHFGVKLHRRERGGDWQELTPPGFPSESSGALDATPAAPSVHQVWALAAGGKDETGLLWAGAIPAGLFRSRDRGESWELVRTLWDRPERARWFGGGYDDAGIHSIHVDPRDPRRLTVAISCGGVWVSPDSGETWACKTKGMYAEYMPPEQSQDPEIQDPHRLAQCAANPDVMWVQHHNGVFRSTNGGDEWAAVETVEPSTFGFAVAIHPQDSDTVWLVPAVKDQCRVPVGGRLVVARTTDGGKSFAVQRNGLPQECAYDLVYRHGLDVDGSGQRLAIGSTTGGLWISENGGERWESVPGRLPPIYQVLFASA